MYVFVYLYDMYALCMYVCDIIGWTFLPHVRKFHKSEKRENQKGTVPNLV